MPQLDKMTLEDIIGRFKGGDLDGAREQVEHLAPKYPNDHELKEALDFFAGGEGKKAIEILEHAANTRSAGYIPPSGLGMEDRRGKSKDLSEGR